MSVQALVLRSCATISLLTLLVGTAGAQRDPHSALLEQAGWNALGAGHPDTAATAFREALAVDPNNPRLHVGLAAAAFAERRDLDAEASARRAIELDQKLMAARELLGAVLYRRGDLDGAIREYDVLVAAEPSKDRVERLERWRREADLRDRMTMAVGSWFTISFEGQADAELAQNALASLDRAATRIGAVLSAYPSRPIPVVLYTGEQFRDVTRAPMWAAGAFDGIIRIPMLGALASPRELERVLAHEFTHALVYDLARRRVPTWFNEGLAAALEVEQPDMSPPAAMVSLQELQESFGRFGDGDARLAYAVSSFAVQRLISDAGGFAVTNLLRDIGAGEAFDTAFAHRFQRSLPEFDASLSSR